MNPYRSSKPFCRWIQSLWFAVIALALIGFELAQAQSPSFQDSYKKKVDHYIFLIHGVGGNAESFGKMEPALEAHLNKSQELGTVKVYSFAYATSDNSIQKVQFAAQFGDFIKTFVHSDPEQKHEPSENYKISVVAHSQGGLIATIWYYLSLTDEDGFHPEIADRAANFVTLGTPFWGSKVARWARDKHRTFRYAKKWFGAQLGPIAKVGQQQVFDMAIGSSANQVFRDNLIQLSQSQLAGIFDRVRILNVHGNANLKRLFAAADDNADLKYHDDEESGRSFEDRLRNQEINDSDDPWNVWGKKLSKGSAMAIRQAFDLQTYAPLVQGDTYRSAFDTVTDPSIYKIDIFSMTLPFVFGEVEYESDALVSVPSSTLNTIVYRNHEPYESDSVVPYNDFKELSVADRLVVRTVHASSNADNFYDITYIPGDFKDPALEYKDCLINELCDHPTFNYVLNYLRGYSVDELTDIPGRTSKRNEQLGLERFAADGKVRLDNFGGFTIALRVRMPEGYENKREDVEIEFDTDVHTGLSPRVASQTPTIVVDKSAEYYAHVETISDAESLKNSVFKWYTGHVLYTDLEGKNLDQQVRQNGAHIVVKVKAPGMKTRKLEALVKPTLSTFIDVAMVPKKTRMQRFGNFLKELF